MKDTRLKVATGLMVAVLTLLGGVTGASAASQASAVRYLCTPAQNLVVTRSETKALVEFVDRTYELERRRSSIGEKYISNTAALVIDGASAVFVAEDRLQLGTCVEAVRIASR